LLKTYALVGVVGCVVRFWGLWVCFFLEVVVGGFWASQLLCGFVEFGVFLFWFVRWIAGWLCKLPQADVSEVFSLLVVVKSPL
jgi:hypothetical protein